MHISNIKNYLTVNRMTTINNLQVNIDKKTRKVPVTEIQGKTARMRYFTTR